MNNADLLPRILDDQLIVPPNLQLGAQLAVAAYVASPYIASPVVTDKLKWVAKGVFSGLSFLYRKTEETYDRLIPGKVKQGVAFVGGWSDYLLHKGILTVEEATDFANFGGTKDPQASISKSRERLDQHDQEFSECCEFFADQAAGYYLQNERQINEKVTKAVKEKSYGFLGDFAGWFMGLSKELIAQTIKANILHVLANLADQGFDPQHPFGDKQSNPFGRLISVIGLCLSDYEQRLEQVEQSPAAQQPDLFRQLFQEISEDLLAKVFPKGADDLQLFHSTIPFMRVAKRQVWKTINQELPGLLEKLYSETRPLSTRHPDWQKQFDDRAHGLKADQLVNLPSSLFLQFVRGNVSSLMDGQIPALEKWLKGKGVDRSGHLSRLLVQFGKEFLLTQDTAVSAMGSFFETYFMERILFNLSNYTPVKADTPMPLDILQKWIEGDCFRMVRSCLAGKTDEANQAMPGALKDLLAPFGLDRMDTFPLPLFIVNEAWPQIQNFQQNALPKLLLDAIPQWTVLSNYSIHKRKCAAWLDDPELIDSCRKMTDLVIAQGMDRYADSEISPFALMNDFLPNHPLTLDQQKFLDEQLDDLLDNDNPSLAILLEFGERCAEAFIFQVCNDLYEKFEVDSSQEGLTDLFDDGATSLENVPFDSFPVWLAKEAADALQDLSPDQFTDEEAEAFRQALELHHAIRFSDDPADQKQLNAAFEKQWRVLAPRFEKISKSLLARLGYPQPETLPFPKPLQKLIWNKIHAILPKKVFEEAGAVLQPLLENERLREEVEALPHGDQLARGCKFLAQDVVEHLPEWETEVIDLLYEQIGQKISDSGIKDEILDLKLGDPTKASLLLHLRSFISQENIGYDSVWNLMEDFIEGMLLKFVVRLSQLSKDELQSIKTLIEDARDRLIALEDDEETIALQLADELIQVLGIEGEEDLFGIPSGVREIALEEAKKKFAQGFLALYRLDDKIRNHTIDEAAVEKHLPVSKVAETVLILIHYGLNHATDHLSSKDEEGELEILPKFVPALNHWLDTQAQKNYQIAALFKEIIADKIPFPYFQTLFDMLDHHQTKPYKEQLADWISPFITNQVVSTLLPLLEKEQQESPHFDKALLLALLPILTRHLKHLKEAALKEGGLNLPNFLGVVGDDLHPALQGEQDDEQGRALFYQEQTALIFQLIFPNGKEDLIPLLSDFPLNSDHVDLIWEMAQTAVSSNLPQALDALFEKEFWVEFFYELYEEMAVELEQPIILDNENIGEAKPLFDDESQEIHQLDVALGEFILEAAKFIELPGVDLKLPGWLKKLAGGDASERKLIEWIGSVVRKKFDTDLLPKVLMRVMHRLSEMEHVKMTKAEKIEAKNQMALDLKMWEKKLVENSIDYFFRMTTAKIDQRADSIENPLLRIFLKAYLRICSLLFSHIAAPLLRFLKLDQVITDYLYGVIDHATDKSIKVFSQPALHEDLVFSGVEAFEEVLAQPNG